eukprot:TRINITY_DN52911_c0_g1_i1.p1 TRINITY_DN52911_c0_g1~~TRINITY_DN52911_c0_g1_i1.p1  ORF type:complete len:299 (+),score=34.14 TRINITY_DN52911_c0_g1_i1:99-899(+)
MALYIYITHLWKQSNAGCTNCDRLRELSDYWHENLDPLFDHLAVFSFSNAMLENLDMYTCVGTPVAIVFFVLEYDRISWLQALVVQWLPDNEAKRAVFWLRTYLFTEFSAFVCILLLSYFHLERPRAHYLCAVSAIALGCATISINLFLPVDFNSAVERATKSGNAGDDFALWAARVQRRVKPVSKFVLGLHVLVLAFGVLKVARPHDRLAALGFGIFETAVIVGYQLYQAVLAVDDVMVGRKFEALDPKGELLKKSEDRARGQAE